MAKDKTGFMSQNIGYSTDPAAAPTSLIEQAGAHEGKAGEIEGQITAASYDAAAKTGSTFYQASVYREAAEIGRAEMDRLNANARGWMGEEAWKQKAEVGKLQPLTGQQMEEVDARFSTIKAAQDQGIFTPEQSRARMASAMREMISSNPGAVATIRAAFEQYTGNGKWDLEAMDNAFKVSTKEDNATKHAYQTAEKIPVAFRTLTNEKGEVVGGLTVDDLAQGQLTRKGPGWDAYLKWGMHERQNTMLQAFETAEKTGKLTTEKRTIALRNILDGSVELAFNVPRLEMSGVLWESKSADEIVAAMGVYRTRIEQALASTFATAHAQIEKLPQEDQAVMFEKLRKTTEEANKRLDAMTKDKDGYLSSVEFFKRNAGMDAQTIESHVKTWDAFVSAGFTPEEIKRMKSEEGRKQILHQYRNDPNHPLVWATKQYEQLRVAIASRSPSAIGDAVNDLRRQERINTIASEIVRNKALPPAGNNPDEVNDVVAAVKLNESRAAEATKKVDLSDADKNVVRAASITLSDNEELVDGMRAAIKGGKLKGDKEAEDFVKQNVAKRTEQWVFGEGSTYYPEKTKAFLQGNKLDVDGTGNVVLTRTSNSEWRVQQEAAAQVRKVNKLIDLLAESSGQDRMGLAQRFVTQTNELPTFERSVGRARAQAMKEIPADVANYLKTVPGYSKLNDATKTIVEEALSGFKSFKPNPATAPSGKLYPTEASMKTSMGNPATDKTTMFAEHDTAELEAELKKHKPGSVAHDVLKKELDSRR